MLSDDSRTSLLPDRHALRASGGGASDTGPKPTRPVAVSSRSRLRGSWVPGDVLRQRRSEWSQLHIRQCFRSCWSSVGAHVLTSETYGVPTTSKDSGSSVVSRSRKIYGIHVAGGFQASDIATTEGYIPIAQFFREQSGYVLVTG